MTGHNVAYLRVSSVDHKTARQLDNMTFDETFTDKASGKNRNRPGLTKCLRHLRKGDTLHVHSIDRLARDMRDLLALICDLTERGVVVRFHQEELSFTGQSNSIQALQLQMMGAFAEFERAMIKERQKEGIAAAKANGKQVGAKPKLSAEQITEIQARLAQGATKKDVAAEYKVSRQTLYNALRRA